MSTIPDISKIITAIGALGTASFGLVDSTKAFWGGVNRFGFNRIEDTVKKLTPKAAASGLTQAKIVDTLRANWYNGTELGGQKSIAKSLIKQALNPGNAKALAAATGVNATILESVASSISTGTALQPNETDVFSRFDFILTALLDEAYQDADQRYTNGTRIVASIFAIVLAVAGGWIVAIDAGGTRSYWSSSDVLVAILVGVLATPLAPIAKNLSSALASAVNAMQSVKK
jgi:hypothetical protein